VARTTNRIATLYIEMLPLNDYSRVTDG